MEQQQQENKKTRSFSFYLLFFMVILILCIVGFLTINDYLYTKDKLDGESYLLQVQNRISGEHSFSRMPHPISLMISLTRE